MNEIKTRMQSHLVEKGDEDVNCEGIPNWLFGLSIETRKVVMPREKE